MKPKMNIKYYTNIHLVLYAISKLWNFWESHFTLTSIKDNSKIKGNIYVESSTSHIKWGSWLQQWSCATKELLSKEGFTIAIKNILLLSSLQKPR